MMLVANFREEKVLRRIQAIGKQLLKYGYIESTSSPNLFICKYDIVVFYADLRSIAKLLIWENPFAVIYWAWQIDKLSLQERQLAVLIELTRLQGVPWRLAHRRKYYDEAKLVLSQ